MGWKPVLHIMAKDLAIVLNNGSINSAVVTAMAAQRFRPVMVYVDATNQPGSRVRASRRTDESWW